jgi:tetratricopeptide (TPR) repeat protein
MQLILLLFVAALMGCVSNTVQTDQLYNSESDFTGKLRSRVVNTAPFIQQEIGHCGPATLAMAIGATGSTYDLKTITDQVYSPGAQGSLQEAMIASARRQGFLAIPINGLPNLLQEIQAGHVVIIFENLGIKWIPQWHYALATGYDLEKRTLTLHSGPNPDEKIEMEEFELSWKLADYWGLVVLQPDKLSATADELTHLRAAAALEKLDKSNEAEKTYLAILDRWPKSLIARIGLGNIYYHSKKYRLAVQYLKTATELYPDSVEAKTNLQIASQALKSRR